MFTKVTELTRLICKIKKKKVISLLNVIFGISQNGYPFFKLNIIMMCCFSFEALFFSNLFKQNITICC